MENIPLNKATAEKEGMEVQERAKIFCNFPDAPIDACDYQEAHDQISAERLDEMRGYIEIIGGEENPEYTGSIIEFLARNYRVSELEKIGLTSINLVDEIRFYKISSEEPGNDTDKIKPKIYTRKEYNGAKDRGTLPAANEWLRVRAASHWSKSDTEYGSIEIFDFYDYPYELPDYVESAPDKDRALLLYLLGHEVGHFVYSSVFLNDDLSVRDDVPERTQFGSLLYVKEQENLCYNYDFIQTFMDCPFTPYLQVRVKALQSLYSECLETQDPVKTDKFMYEFSEYYAEFFAEASALAKTKDPNTLDENEKFFVGCYDQAEGILHQ